MKKPFDLKAALAGKPIVDQDGKPLTITGLSLPWRMSGNGAPQNLVALVQRGDGTLEAYVDEEGISTYGSTQLFMAPTTVERWVNLYPPLSGILNVGDADHFPSEGAADTKAGSSRIFGRAFKITYEE